MILGDYFSSNHKKFSHAHILKNKRKNILKTIVYILQCLHTNSAVSLLLPKNEIETEGAKNQLTLTPY